MQSHYVGKSSMLMSHMPDVFCLFATCKAWALTRFIGEMAHLETNVVCVTIPFWAAWLGRFAGVLAVAFVCLPWQPHVKDSFEKAAQLMQRFGEAPRSVKVLQSKVQEQRAAPSSFQVGGINVLDSEEGLLEVATDQQLVR